MSNEITTTTTNNALSNAGTMDFIKQFVTDDCMKSVETLQDEKGKSYQVAVYTINGKPYTLASETEQKAFDRLRETVAVSKGATYATYAQLYLIEKLGTHKTFGCDTIEDLAHIICNVSKDSAAQYLNAIRAFYNADIKTMSVTPKSPLVKGASLTNLKQCLGILNKKCDGSVDKFVKDYIVSNKLDINGSLSQLKKGLKELANDLDEIKKPNTDAKSDNDNTSGDTSGDTDENGGGEDTVNAMTDSEKATYYLGLSHTALRAVLSDDVEKLKKADKLITELNKLIP